LYGVPFAITPDLAVGDVVTSWQVIDGTTSVESAPITVVDYPGALPTPEIVPTLIHECASSIAVVHVPGADVIVYSNGRDPAESRSSGDHSVVFPTQAPFEIGDTFTVQARLCGEVSELSEPQSAVAAPATLGAPTFEPSDQYVGQQLVTLGALANGAFVDVREQTLGPLEGVYSWPFSWYPWYDLNSELGRPMQAGDQLYASQRLCSSGSEAESELPYPCESLPHPRIAAPIAGQTWVTVDEAVPGARIRVYDSSGVEIGGGAGAVVRLRRALSLGERITAVQSLGKCTSRNGLTVTALAAAQQR
jgi:hypothetical protein